MDIRIIPVFILFFMHICVDQYWKKIVNLPKAEKEKIANPILSQVSTRCYFAGSLRQAFGIAYCHCFSFYPSPFLVFSSFCFGHTHTTQLLFSFNVSRGERGEGNWPDGRPLVIRSIVANLSFRSS